MCMVDSTIRYESARSKLAQERAAENREIVANVQGHDR